MSTRPAARPRTGPTSRRQRKATQRERLLAGMVTTANRDGCGRANVSTVIREAGVSRPTFYDYFADRDDCFVAAIVDTQELLLRRVCDAVAGAAPEQALAAAIEATLAFAASDPAEARFLMQETLAGGPQALDARDRGIARAAEVVEQAYAGAGDGAGASSTPDVPTAAVLGAIQRILVARLRRGERDLGGLPRELLDWLHSYRRPAASHRWRTLEPLASRERSPHAPPVALRAPAALGPGRPRLSEAEVAENQRLRIMFATSQIVRERGYAAATVADIARLARVDGRAFYRLFADKQDAFGAIQELGFQHLMAAVGGAFFAGRRWPERIWEALRATAHSIDENPAIAHVAFVEAYAAGPGGIQRVEDSRAGFTIFLQEGYQCLGDGHAPPPAALEAIITTIFEIVYLQTRARAAPRTAGLVAHFAHLALTPFIGLAPSDEFIEERLGRRSGGTGGKRRVQRPHRGTVRAR